MKVNIFRWFNDLPICSDPVSADPLNLGNLQQNHLQLNQFQLLFCHLQLYLQQVTFLNDREINCCKFFSLQVVYFAANILAASGLFRCKWSILLQLVAASGFAASVSFCCKWPAVSRRAASGKKVAAIGLAANCLNLEGPQKTGRCKWICCKCPYTWFNCCVDYLKLSHVWHAFETFLSLLFVVWHLVMTPGNDLSVIGIVFYLAFNNLLWQIISMRFCSLTN